MPIFTLKKVAAGSRRWQEATKVREARPMDNGKREFDELRQILQKLDRSLDEAQQKRTHGSTPPVPVHVPPPMPSNGPIAPTAPVAPAVIPDQGDDADEQTGRLKAKPLRRHRPENSGPTHGWVH